MIYFQAVVVNFNVFGDAIVSSSDCEFPCGRSIKRYPFQSYRGTERERTDITLLIGVMPEALLLNGASPPKTLVSRDTDQAVRDREKGNAPLKKNESAASDGD